MSNKINDDLLERAAICIDYFEGKAMAELLQADLDTNDLENLYYHVKQAEDAMFHLEYRPNEVYGEEFPDVY